MSKFGIRELMYTIVGSVIILLVMVKIKKII